MTKSRRTKSRRFDQLAARIADKLTPEQAIRLYDIAYPLSEEERQISVDDLLKALKEDQPCGFRRSRPGVPR